METNDINKQNRAESKMKPNIVEIMSQRKQGKGMPQLSRFVVSRGGLAVVRPWGILGRRQSRHVPGVVYFDGQKR